MEEFRRQGYGVCAVTYDTVEILADFAQRRNITYPLLADPESKMIRDFGVLNTSVPRDHLWYGVPYPGTFVVDANGIVQAKYFESSYRDRYSAPTILLREFDSVAGTRQTTVQTNYLAMTYYATRDRVRPNLRFTVVADFQLPPKMHVYAPEVKTYIPIRFELDPSSHFVLHATEYPKSEILYLPAIQEAVPVYQGKFRIMQDVTMAGSQVLQPILSGSREVKLTGKLYYQACDDKICYLPESLPLEWVLKVEPLDRERVPEAIQHRTPTAGGKGRN